MADSGTLLCSPAIPAFLACLRPQEAPEVDGVMKHRPNHIPPGDDDHRAIGEHPDVLHFLPAEHARTDTQHLAGVRVDELGKVIGEDSPFPCTSSQSPVNQRSFSPSPIPGREAMRHRPVSHVQFQQAFFHPPFTADGVDHVDAACAGTGTASERWSYPYREKECFVTLPFSQR